MKNLFECASSHWVRYSEYEWKEMENGTSYWMPLILAEWEQEKSRARDRKDEE